SSVASHSASNVVRCVELFDGDADAIGLQLAKAAHPGGPVLARGAIIGDRPLELPRGHPNRTGECRERIVADKLDEIQAVAAFVRAERGRAECLVAIRRAAPVAARSRWIGALAVAGLDGDRDAGWWSSGDRRHSSAGTCAPYIPGRVGEIGVGRSLADPRDVR